MTRHSTPCGLSAGKRDINIFAYFRDHGARGFWLVMAEGSNIKTETDPTYTALLESYREFFKDSNIEPAK